jgi:hypothetical protein
VLIEVGAREKAEAFRPSVKLNHFVMVLFLYSIAIAQEIALGRHMAAFLRLGIFIFY